MAQLRQFFDDYAEALGSANLDDLAEAYAEQFMANGPGFRTSMDNDAQFRTRLTQTAQFYKSIGVDIAEVKNYLEAELGSGFWLTKVEWELLDEDLNTLVTFDNTYVVDASRGTEGGIAKIVLYITHNEHERMQDMGLID